MARSLPRATAVASDNQHPGQHIGAGGLDTAPDDRHPWVFPTKGHRGGQGEQSEGEQEPFRTVGQRSGERDGELARRRPLRRRGMRTVCPTATRSRESATGVIAGTLAPPSQHQCAQHAFWTPVGGRRSVGYQCRFQRGSPFRLQMSGTSRRPDPEGNLPSCGLSQVLFARRQETLPCEISTTNQYH